MLLEQVCLLSLDQPLDMADLVHEVGPLILRVCEVEQDVNDSAALLRLESIHQLKHTVDVCVRDRVRLWLRYMDNLYFLLSLFVGYAPMLEVM